MHDLILIAFNNLLWPLHTTCVPHMSQVFPVPPRWARQSNRIVVIRLVGDGDEYGDEYGVGVGVGSI